MSEFKIIEHSSDIGIEVCSDSLEGVFDHGAWGFYSVGFDTLRLTGQGRAFAFESTGRDLGDLAVDFFNELIYLCETESLVLKEITSVHEKELGVEGTLYRFDRKNSRFSRIIKAATYHGLEFTNNGGACRLKIIFDI